MVAFAVNELVVIIFAPADPVDAVEAELLQLPSENNWMLEAASDRFTVICGVCELPGDTGEIDV